MISVSSGTRIMAQVKYLQKIVKVKHSQKVTYNKSHCSRAREKVCLSVGWYLTDKTTDWVVTGVMGGT